MLLLSLAPLTWSSVASAQARDPKRAEELFQEGKRQYEANDLGHACTTLYESDQLDPAIGTHGLLAACYEKQGKLAKALAAYRQTQSRAEKASDNRAAYAKERADALEAQVPRLKVTAQGNEGGLQLTADGSAIRAGDAVPLDPGEHVIVARAPGKKEFELRVALKAGERVDRAIPPLESDGSVAAPPPPPVEQPPPVTTDTTSDDGDTRRTVGLVIGGVGLAGVVVGSIFGVMTFSKAGEATDLAAQCPSGDSSLECQQTHKDYDGVLSDRDTFGMVSNVALIAGGAFVVAGAIIYFTAPKAGAATTTGSTAKVSRLQVLPTAGPRGAGALVTGAF